MLAPLFEEKSVKANYIVVTVVTAFLLFVLGFRSFSELLLKLTKNLAEIYLVTLNPKDAYKFAFSNALLLAACAPAAAVMLWAYSRKRPGWPRIFGFFVCLFVAIASAVGGIGLRLVVIANQLRVLSEFEFGITPSIVVGYLHYSQWGFGTLVIACGIVTIIFLVLSQQRIEVSAEEA